jgi:hypothetical protein
MRQWKWLPPRRGDIAAIVLGGLLVLLITIAVLALGGPPSLRARANWGFGPEWDCTSLGRGEPLCIKKSP